tara:strand:- start:2444 stop:3895 length:1452 start_codon:yes stop_codon:yes gene_type:complete
MVIKETLQSQIDEALNNFKKAKYQDAINILENLDEKNSNFLICWYLGHSYFRIYNYLTAIKYIKKSIKLKTPDELNQNFLGEVLLQSNQYEEAIDSFKNVIKINEQNVNSIFNLGKIYSQQGKFELAKTYYDKILQIDKNNLEVLYELIKIDKIQISADTLKDLETQENQNDKNDIYKNFILAEKAKKSKNYRDEINYLIKGHKEYLKSKKKASFQENNYFTNLLPQFVKKFNKIDLNIKNENCPIFIMGLPRSGTTMIENLIFSSDNQIIKGDETDVMGKVFFSNQIISNYDDINLNTNYDFTLKALENLKKEITNKYNQIRMDISEGLFTDKSLENFLYIDILYKIFPNAKFIYCKRNYLANFLGILKVFLPNILWSHSIEKIMIFMELYQNKLNEVLSNKFIDIKIIEIENFSEDPLNNSRELFEFLDLKWTKNIFDKKNEKEMVIKTLSNLQVRNKITQHDLSYLENYIPFLKNYGIKI